MNNAAPTAEPLTPANVAAVVTDALLYHLRPADAATIVAALQTALNAFGESPTNTRRRIASQLGGAFAADPMTPNPAAVDPDARRPLGERSTRPVGCFVRGCVVMFTGQASIIENAFRVGALSLAEDVIELEPVQRSDGGWVSTGQPFAVSIGTPVVLIETREGFVPEPGEPTATEPAADLFETGQPVRDYAPGAVVRFQKSGADMMRAERVVCVNCQIVTLRHVVWIEGGWQPDPTRPVVYRVSANRTAYPVG